MPSVGRAPSATTWSHLLALCAATALAAWFRLYQLDAIPPALFGDAAADGLVAKQILAGARPLYVEEPEATKWGSREPLYHYLVAGVFAVAGASAIALRLTSALIGIATVPLLYLLCLRAFGARVAAVAGAHAVEARETFDEITLDE